MSILQYNLGSKKRKMAKYEIIEYNNEWSKNGSSEIFAIWVIIKVYNRFNSKLLD